jgi:hypothetical protein
MDAAALAGRKLIGKTYLYICSRTSRFIILPTLLAWSLFSGRDRRVALEMCIRVAASDRDRRKFEYWLSFRARIRIRMKSVLFPCGR